MNIFLVGGREFNFKALSSGEKSASGLQELYYSESELLLALPSITLPLKIPFLGRLSSSIRLNFGAPFSFFLRLSFFWEGCLG